MAEKIVIAEVDIDMEKALADTLSLKEKVGLLRAQLKQVKETSGEVSVEYVQMSAELKSATSQLKSHEHMLSKVSEAENSAKGSLEQLRAKLAFASKEWAKLSEEERLNTTKGKELTAQKLALTNAIKAEEMATGDARRNVGNYAESLSQVGGSAGVAVNGLKSLIVTLKALIANPVVLIISGIIGAFTLLSKAFKKSQENSIVLNKAMGAVSGVFNKVLDVIKPVAEFLVNNLVKAFEFTGKAADKTMNLIARGLDALGFDKASEKIQKWSADVKESAKEGSKLAEAETRLANAQRDSQRIMLEYQKRAEKLRQIRDDETLSIAERIKANKDLGRVLDEQTSAELSIAKQALSVANMRIKIEGESNSNLDARAEALTQIADIEERITGQRSEQLKNANALKILQNDETARVDAEMKVQAMRDELDAFLKTAEEKKGVTEQLNNDIAYLNETFRANEAAAIQLDWENKQAYLETTLFGQLDIEQAAMERSKASELANAEKVGASKLLIEKKYAAAEKKIEQAKRDAKLSLAQGAAQDLATIFGETTAVGKAAAVAATTIDTFRSATAAYTGMVSAIPGPVGIAAGVLAAGASVAMGIANVKKILAVKADGSAGGGADSGGGSPTVATSVPTQQMVSTQTSVGNGIVSRGTVTGDTEIPQREVAIIIDDVTAAQKSEAEKTRTSTL